jgi:hypothetical protein
VIILVCRPVTEDLVADAADDPRPAYLPHLAAAEIDLLLAPSWPIRPERAMLLCLVELLATGRLEGVDAAQPRRWPLRRLSPAGPLPRGILLSVAGLVDEGSDGTDATTFCRRVRLEFGDALDVGDKGAPGGTPEGWFRRVVADGLGAEGVLEIGKVKPLVPGDPWLEGVSRLRSGDHLADYYEQVRARRSGGGRLRSVLRRRPAPGPQWPEPALDLALSTTTERTLFDAGAGPQIWA